MKVERLPIALVMGLFVLLSVSYAATYYVHPDSVLNSIQAAIDGCVNDDTVLVGPGTYVENINFNGMAITVTSEYGPDSTIIDGSNPAHPDTGSVVLFVSGEDTNSVLNGFTIMNGTGTFVPSEATYEGGGIYCHTASPTITGNTITDNTSGFGGGIECEDNSSPTITDNVITNNTATWAGGGIDHYIWSSPYIGGNTIDSNEAEYGGGIQCFSNCSPEIIDNSFSGNSASFWGGGIRCGSYSSPTIIGNTITDNTAGTLGGGIKCDAVSSPTIGNCTISNNDGDGVYCEEGSNPEIHYNDISDNIGYGVRNTSSSVIVNAENNWWGDSTGPYHPDSNQGGLGNPVSNYVDFIPWLTEPGIKEYELTQTVFTNLQISPNPFSKRTKISFGNVYGAKSAELRIYDATGRAVKEFNHLIHNQISWNGTDDLNRQLPSGVYLLKFQAGDYSATEKLLLIR